jgi:catechol 2,3-dioxygenase-like lactoylglutathione lyase family enzyme
VATIPASVGAITLFVADPVRAKEFYARAFGWTVVYQDPEAATLKLDNLLLNLLKSSAAGELIEPAEVGTANAGARFQLTIWVPDADAACAALRERGVDLLNGPMDRPWGVRTAAFADPDGHVWEVAAQLGEGKQAADE